MLYCPKIIRFRSPCTNEHLRVFIYFLNCKNKYIIEYICLTGQKKKLELNISTIIVYLLKGKF
jgi:hypothetical protein